MVTGRHSAPQVSRGEPSADRRVAALYGVRPELRSRVLEELRVVKDRLSRSPPPWNDETLTGLGDGSIRPSVVTRMASVFVLLASLALSLGAGALGSRPTLQAIPGWYRALNKPSWNPPNWVFGPVWTVLYVLMAVAAWLVWSKVGFDLSSPWLLLYCVQLALNVIWSFLFFGARRPDWALTEIAFLWLSILATLLAFWKISLAAGLLLVPYLAWVTFAGALNATIVRLNPPHRNPQTSETADM